MRYLILPFIESKQRHTFFEEEVPKRSDITDGTGLAGSFERSASKQINFWEDEFLLFLRKYDFAWIIISQILTLSINKCWSLSRSSLHIPQPWIRPSINFIM